MNDNDVADRALLGQRIARYLAMKRRRAAAFGRDLFIDPGWDIILDLYVAAAEGRTVSVSSSCLAAGTPATTGLRWVNQLIREGLLVRTGDASDGRRSFLTLSTEARETVERLWSAL